MIYSLELCIPESYETKHCELATFKAEELPRYNRIINRLHRLIGQAIETDNFNCLRDDPAAKMFNTEWLYSAACAGYLGYRLEVKNSEEFKQNWRHCYLEERDCGTKNGNLWYLY